MINDILSGDFIAEIILWFIIFAYISMRIKARLFQKTVWLSNLEYWAFYNLADLYKDNWYPNPTEEALLTINNIKWRIKRGQTYL